MSRPLAPYLPLRRVDALRLALAIALCVALFAQVAIAKPKIRDSFFEVYPGAVGTALGSVPSQSSHCGVCHWQFQGAGTRNPYGANLEAIIGNYPNTAAGRFDAIVSIQSEDPDGDGFSTLVEVTDTINYLNTPTFPGLTPGNVGSVTQVDVADIQDYLVPSQGGDTTPPDVAVTSPDGGELLTANASTTVLWTASDASGIAGINLYVSLDGGVSYSPAALGLSNTGSHTWFPANRPTTLALFRVEAIDNAFNIGQDESDGVFTIQSPPGGLAPTTLRDFDQPGTQPFDSGILNPPEACAVCHGNYDTAVEPYFNWQGSMMAQASLDPLFLANMVIANQDAPDSGDMCLRCHLDRGWLQGRSIPTDGSQMLSTDESGVACDLCHRLVDPIPNPENPAEDTDILAALDFPPDTVGNGMAVIDPTGARRGPFLNADSGHPVLVSPFHREAALCGTCHDVSNPAFEKDINGNYVPNAFDTPATDFSAHTLLPVERTYSEWFYSAYNTLEGVYAPQFGGNKDYVSTCQDCHMRDVTGVGCNSGTAPTRTDLPLHDLTGGSTWLPGLLPALFPGQVDEAALQAGIARAQYMIENAATLEVAQNDSTLEVTVTNQTGHKLPTGYPEGRRMWINVKFYDAAMALISESGAYDPATGVLSHDSEVKIYEVEPGLDAITAPIAGEPVGPSFHFVLNNKVYKDNRIPPRGFTNAAYDDFGGTPVDATYADGQHWDVTTYAIPPGTASADVTLSYQSTSKEFVEFLRDENVTDSKGQEMYDLWNNNGKAPPQVVQSAATVIIQCGNGNPDPTEECDDGNTTPGDCCSATCTIEPASTECRAVAGACDVAEFCDGVAASCPADAKSTAVCRAAADVCDAAESCDGVGNDCPVDGFASPATECRASAGVCDFAENCTGTAAACPADAKSTAVCRAAADVCDAAESCDGVDNDCPADGFEPDGTACTDVDACTDPDECASGVCVGGPLLNCDDLNPCTADACDSVSGCTHDPIWPCGIRVPATTPWGRVLLGMMLAAAGGLLTAARLRARA